MNYSKQNPLKIFLITQNEPFYLPSAIEYFLTLLPDNIKLCGAYVLEGSPFGKKKTFLQKMKDTYKIFGLKFFLFYSAMFLKSKFTRKSVGRILSNSPIYRFGDMNINSKIIIDELSSLEPDIIISLASNQIFKKELIELPKITCLNIHTAMLPKYRGLMPVFWALMHNEKVIGVSVFEIDEGIDTGDIVKQQCIQVESHSMHELIKQTKSLGVFLLVEALKDYISNSIIKKPNDDLSASSFSFPKRRDVKTFIQIGKRFF